MSARSVDDEPEFLYVPAGQVLAVEERTGAIPCNIPDVEMSPVGDAYSFDAFLKKDGLNDLALQQSATIIRGADTARLGLTPQSPGLLAFSLGLSELLTNDHE